MLTIEEKREFIKIYEELSENLDITQTQYDTAVQSYQGVGAHLSKSDSLLSPYKPEILPQGSFLLGTMIRPINDCDELDVDLVCRLEGKKASWTQYDLKKIVGDRLNEHVTYSSLLEKEKRRCWTLKYAESSKYHMDILPAIVSTGHQIVLEKAFSHTGSIDFKKIAIRITDNENYNYKSETDPDYWNKSNPFGYAVWFQDRCNINIRKSIFLSENVNPLPKFQKEKLPLQRVVQLLKRHRDLMFNGDDHKPISIIITTLASRAYQKETDIISALENIIFHMENYIQEKYSKEHCRLIKWVENPVNEEENFADKWPDCREKEINFDKWLEKLKGDYKRSISSKGFYNIETSLSKMFGKDVSKKTFSNLAEKDYRTREQGKLYMNTGTGILTESSEKSKKVENHNFHGED